MFYDFFQNATDCSTMTWLHGHMTWLPRHEGGWCADLSASNKMDLRQNQIKFVINGFKRIFDKLYDDDGNHISKYMSFL